MIRRPPRSTQTDTLFPYTTLFRSDGRPLSNTVGTVLDPIFSLRYHLMIPPGKVARVAFWTVVAPSQAELLDLVDKHHDRDAFDRAKTLRSEEHTSELQSLMRISYAVFCFQQNIQKYYTV